MGMRDEPTLGLQLMALMYLAQKSVVEIGEVVGKTGFQVRQALASPAGVEIQRILRAEAQSEIFDPVQRQLDAYSKIAMHELWDMRDDVESEKLKKDILLDVLHMAGYRPHTNTDNAAAGLPTILIGQINIDPSTDGNGQSQQEAIDVPAEFSVEAADDVDAPAEQECDGPAQEEDDSGDLSESWGPPGEIERGPGAASGERPRDQGEEQTIGAIAEECCERANGPE